MAVLACQKKCLKFENDQISTSEQQCLFKCADHMTFFDTTTYELDSINDIARQEGKPKKAFMYY